MKRFTTIDLDYHEQSPYLWREAGKRRREANFTSTLSVLKCHLLIQTAILHHQRKEVVERAWPII